MAVTRVHSSQSQVFVGTAGAASRTRIPAIQSLSISTDKDITELQELGELSHTNRILNSNQTTKLSLDLLVATGASGIDPFYTFQEQQAGFLSTGKFDFAARDNAGETLISGAYLTQYSLEASVGALVEGSVAYDADTIDFHAANRLTDVEESDDSFGGFFRPRDIRITTEDGLVSENASSDDLNIQNFSLKVGVSREPKTRLGNRIPEFRYPTLPLNGSLDISMVKNQVTGINLASLVLETGTIKLDLRDAQKNSVMDFVTSGCSLISVAESNDLDGNATINFSYSFSVKN
tara:strand:+ start:263 stop:1138 length:876 start_codon:yes stop_codon:yes gene_type:complete